MQNMPIAIFRGDDTDALGYQTIVGTIRTDLDLTGCKAVFKYLSFSVEFDPIPEDKKLTVIIPASETSKFPPGLGYASLRVYDSEGKLCTFSNRIMVFVATKTPMFGNAEFEVDFNVRPELEPLKIFVGPNPDDFDEYRGFLEKVIDRASAEKYGLAILLDAIDSDLGANDGVAATPVAVKAAYAAIIKKLTDDYYTADETDEAIDRVAAYYITYDAAGNPFPTYAALANATTVYSGGEVRVPTRNDYCVVLADETHDNAEYRYIYAVAEGQTTGSWQPQFPVEGVMTIDQSVTKDSQNPVSGGGIWSAIWGALTALPGFSSIYDWCVAKLRGKTDLNVYGYDNASVTFPGGFSITYMDDSYVAGGDGETIEFYGPITSTAVPQYNFWVPYAYKDVTGFDPQAQLVWCLYGGSTPDYLMYGAGASYAIDNWNTEAPVLTLDDGEESGGHPTMTRPIGATGDTLAKASQLAGKQDALSMQQLANIAAVPNKLDASNGVATGLVTYLGTFNGFEYGLRFGSYGSDYAVQIVARSAGQQASWQATANLMVQKSKTGYAALLSDIPSVPSASTSTPQMDGTGAAGSSTAYARGDHRHPSDTTKLDKNGPNNRKIQWNAESGFLEVVDQNGLKFIFPSNSFGSAEFAASREYVNDKTPYKLTTKTIDNGAVTLDNRALNAVAVSSTLASLTVNFPTATSGKARDFGLRLTVASGITTAPELALPQGVVCENADGAAPEIGADGAATILYFTETASGVFLVKGEVVTAIS